MLGGGTWTQQNKVLNGAYINFVSASRANAAISDRGIAAMPLELKWGVDTGVFEVTARDFAENSLKIFGYAADSDEMKGLRDLFCTGLRLLYVYKLTNGGVKASNTYAEAKYCGTRGNDLKIVISANPDQSSHFDVATYLGTMKVDEQVNVSGASDLVPNDFVTFKSSATLAVTAGSALTNGTNGTVTGTTHTAALAALEPYAFNTLGVITTDSTTKGLYAAYTARQRDEVGKKFQCVLHNHAADYEGVINVKNGTDAELVWWVTGAEACAPVNGSLLNAEYTGETDVPVNYTQVQLKTAMQSGEFVFHNVNGVTRVLADINSLTTSTTEKDVTLFGENQSIRVMDQIANDIALIFNTKYLGQIPNDAEGRISLWADIVNHHQNLEAIRAIEEFNADEVTVNAGDARNAVVIGDAVRIINAMAKLYMTVTVQ